MKLTLKEKLDLQRTARIITESQYKKLLNEEESMSTSEAKAIASKKFEQLKNSSEIQKIAQKIMQDPKAMENIKTLAQDMGMNSIEENSIDSDFLDKTIEKAIQTVTESSLSEMEDSGKWSGSQYYTKEDEKKEQKNYTIGMTSLGAIAGPALLVYLKPAMFMLAAGATSAALPAVAVAALAGAALAAVVSVVVTKATSKFK